jgi:hypothetical protein
VEVLANEQPACTDAREQAAEGVDLVAPEVGAVVEDDVWRICGRKVVKEAGIRSVADLDGDARVRMIAAAFDDVDADDLGGGEIVLLHAHRRAVAHADLDQRQR